MTNGRVRIFSDLHLGHRASRITRVEDLRPLIRGADTVIFNGDTWQELARPWREKSKEMLDELRAIGASENCEMLFLPGNHDPGWDGPGYLELAQGRIVITHGDALMLDSSPWKREIMFGRKVVEELWQNHPVAATDVDTRLHLAREIARRLPSKQFPQGRSLIARAWDAATPPRRALKMLDAWLYQGNHGAVFCECYFPQTEALIVGHLHHAGSWLVRGRRIINTGTFVVPGTACWAELHQGFLSFGKIVPGTDSYQLGERKGLWKFN
ncbi:MAG: metallophosphoesterase [Armatimonadetes bacterium]|nr:metallophosphoesterase [Akkermansiaceae bacterium]